MYTDADKLKKDLTYDRSNVYNSVSENDMVKAYEYSEKYKKYLDECKTEREAVNYAVDTARENGYKSYNFGDKIEIGGKYYYNNRGKSVYLFRIGKCPVSEGVNISAAHIDSPRIDLKQNPVYEDTGMSFFKTHYYGGIKKYQWTTIPLAIHGVVIKKNGESVNIKIGEDDDDPIFYINDLLPHLAQDQMEKKLKDGISGENLNLLIGSRPLSFGDEKDSVKLNTLKILNEKYGITEEDFLSAELSAVPAFKARDIGFDRSLIGSYGHDDRVCAYAALTAFMESDDSEKTDLLILADKEETGSDGNTGMQSVIFTDILSEIALSQNINIPLMRSRSKCLSADVNSAYDPNFSEVFERKNSSYINNGVVLTKFTGARGKSGTNDASAEYVGEIRDLFNREGIVWQTGELGKVDQGGGGTVAKYISVYNIDTVDLGVPVISMHAPYEVISKADLYMTYLAFKAFNRH